MHTPIIISKVVTKALRLKFLPNVVLVFRVGNSYNLLKRQTKKQTCTKRILILQQLTRSKEGRAAGNRLFT